MLCILSYIFLKRLYVFSVSAYSGLLSISVRFFFFYNPLIFKTTMPRCYAYLVCFIHLSKKTSFSVFVFTQFDYYLIFILFPFPLSTCVWCLLCLSFLLNSWYNFPGSVCNSSAEINISVIIITIIWNGYCNL